MDSSVNDLSKDELIKRCNKLLLIAQKAKQAKDECNLELKNLQENEQKLLSEISRHQEILKASENEAKRTINKVTDEKTLWKNKAIECQNKLKLVEEKYAILEEKLTDFQNNYLDEKNKHAKLEALLGKLEEKADKSGSERSESRDGLPSVAENEEIESIVQKLEEAVKSSKSLKTSNKKLLEKVEVLETNLKCKTVEFNSLNNMHNMLLDKCIDRCKQFSQYCALAQDGFTASIPCNDALLELKDTKERLNQLNQNNTKLECDALKESELSNRIEVLEKALSDSGKNLEETQKSYSNCRVQVDLLTEERNSLQLTIQSCQSENELHALEKIQELQNVIETLRNQLQVLKDANSTADNKLYEVQEKSTRLSETLEATVNERCKEYDDIKRKADAYECTVPQLKAFRADLLRSKEALNHLRNIVSAGLSDVTTDYKQFGLNISQTIDDFARKLTESNYELLGEMNMMNQALKERGEVISNFEETVSSLQCSIAENDVRYLKLSEKYELNTAEITSIRAQLDIRDKTIREMEDEIWRLRNSDSAADTLSTSTISKVEESQRLTDVEDSFEEKYNKLKPLAIKLKKKVIEQQMQLDEERAKLIGERAESKTALQTQMKSLSNIQMEYDALLDKSDAERRESTELRKSLNKTRDELGFLKQQTEELRNEQNKFVQEKATFDMIKKELTSKIQSLKKEVEKESEKIKKSEEEKSAIEAEMKKIETRLAEEKDLHKVTIGNLEEERQKQKKQTLLSLEMADYERTVAEMSRKLSSKDDQIRELSANLETQRDLTKTLQESVSSLESRVATEQAVTDASKSRQSALQEEAKCLRAELATFQLKVMESDRAAQERVLESDAIKLELSSLAAESVKAEEKLRSLIETLRQEMRVLEEKRCQMQDLLNRRDLELEELRKEFESYKVRAQSVLRQSQHDIAPGRQLDIEQELIQLKASSDATKAKLDEALLNFESVKNDLSVVSKEKMRLQERVNELQDEVKEVNGLNAQLQAAEHRARDECDEAVRKARVQQDTLVQCYKKELEEAQAKQRSEIEECRLAQQKAETALQLHLSSPPSPPSHRRLTSSSGAESSHRRQPSTGFVPVRSERETLDVLMLEREACEGSESVDSSSPRVVPLEQLLFPSQPSASSATIAQWKDKLEKSESRIQHLTSLLSDAEGDAARLQQLNQVLKEEIRRKERNVAREEHAGNLEYLKNVVVKFATLPHGDERTRLVPVLNTILKLSREEERGLYAAARGEAPAGSAGWGSYLGIWPTNQGR